MKCRVCRGPAIIDVPRHNANFCGPHFLDMCRRQVRKAIDDFDMLVADDRILVAVSGGKDSLAVWDMLLDLGYHADGLYIGLGIGDYSDVSGEYARAYAQVAALPADTGEVELAFEVSNHLSRYGGSFIAPTLGLQVPLVAHLDFIRSLSMFLFGAMVFAALYHFVAYSLNRDAVVSLWFGLFAALLGMRTLLTEPLATFSVPFIGQDWVWRLDFSSSLLLLPTAYHFFMLSFPRQISSKISPWISGFCTGAAAFTRIFHSVEFQNLVFASVVLAWLRTNAT